MCVCGRKMVNGNFIYKIFYLKNLNKKSLASPENLFCFTSQDDEQKNLFAKNPEVGNHITSRLQCCTLQCILVLLKNYEYFFCVTTNNKIFYCVMFIFLCADISAIDSQYLFPIHL